MIPEGRLLLQLPFIFQLTKGKIFGIIKEMNKKGEGIVQDVRDIPIKALRGVGPAKEAAYARLGIFTVGDLLYHFPRAYENRGNVKRLCESDGQSKMSVVMTVGTQPRRAMIRRGMTLVKFRAYDDSGDCEIVYINQDYVQSMFPVGGLFRFYGKVERDKGRWRMTSPVAEPVVESKPLPPLYPVYPLTEGLSSKQIGQHMEMALALAAQGLEDPIPEPIRVRLGLCTLSFALRAMHTPTDLASVEIAQRRLMFEELFLFGVGLRSARHTTELIPAPACQNNDLRAFLSLLPYELTEAQRRTVEQIRADMARPYAMTRMVVGDVGCGKTVCAAAAAVIAVQSGRQAAIMVPTEILARQHYADLAPYFEKLGMRCSLLIGAMTPAQKKKVHAALSEQDEKKRVQIVIGTQALLSDGVEFAAPGLVITDEQHRFGVAQRAKLSDKNAHAHLLCMSATPIPRSLALVMYGDLAVSRIDTMPPGRQRVDTFAVNQSYRERLDAFIRKNVDEGGQVYVVCPAVEEQEDEEDLLLEEIGIVRENKPPLQAAVQYAEQLSARLQGYSVAFVHGKMKPKDKDAVMNRFAAGEIDVLVSTTVIEVGVNVPRASLIIVENAERFGLSQLHQLRGRVGRGTRKSYCVLVAGAMSDREIGEVAQRRLQTMKTTYDGFAIAEQDLAQRGPGDFFAKNAGGAIRQSGGVEFRLASGCSDADLLTSAFAAADEVVANRELAEHPALQDAVGRMFADAANHDILN